MADQELTQCTIGGPVKVTVRDGKIIKMRPFVLDDTDKGGWTITARGRNFTDPRRINIGPFVVEKKTF
jgi:hypothetical protein